MIQKNDSVSSSLKAKILGLKESLLTLEQTLYSHCSFYFPKDSHRKEKPQQITMLFKETYQRIDQMAE